MKKNLISLLQCPKCKGKLKWFLNETYQDQIIEAQIFCYNCNSEFFIEEGIANFNYNKEKKVNQLSFKDILWDNSDIIERLLSKKDEELNCGDLAAKAEFFKLHGEKEKSEHLYELFNRKFYTQESKRAVNQCFKILEAELENINSPNNIVLDFAAGHGNLCMKIDKFIGLEYIINDKDLNVLKEIQGEMKFNKKENINYIAFDIGHSPFTDKSVNYAISFVGFQNIYNYEEAIKELIRIISNNLIHISTFCNEDDKINLFVLKKEGISDMWIKRQFKKLWFDYHLNYEELYSTIADIYKLQPGEIIKGYQVDRFPIIDTKVEYNVIKVSL